MKIGLVSPYDFAYPGGVKSHIARLAAHFTEAGHYVKILAPFSFKEPLDVNIIPVCRPTFYIPSGGSWARMNLFPRPWSPLKAILEEEQFDILHIHEPMLPWLPVNAIRLSNSINIGTFHAYHRRSLGYILWKPYLNNVSMPKLHGIIAVSESAKEFNSHYFPGNYTIIPNGIDFDHFSMNGKPFNEYRDGKFNILFVGRIEKRKGLRYLINAYKKIKNMYPDTRLIIVGPGGLSHKILGHDNLKDVVFTGYASHEDLPRYYKTADVFCAPATGAESFGIVLLEAMAVGVPVVASNIKGYAGLITNGENGLLVQPKDEDGLVNAIVELMKNKQLREKFITDGKNKAENYRWEKVAKNVLNFYEETMQRFPLVVKNNHVK
ncbi:MAG: glycosyltransferase family 4 protein [Chloroflexi bacterium]|nr:glycosyltransferase family 4 protein [Chloroflexota bacterium]